MSIDQSESSSESESSSTSQCPSWMLEDLEGLLDDDNFQNSALHYARKLLQTLRAYLRELKKKKKEN